MYRGKSAAAAVGRVGIVRSLNCTFFQNENTKGGGGGWLSGRFRIHDDYGISTWDIPLDITDILGRYSLHGDVRLAIWSY